MHELLVIALFAIGLALALVVLLILLACFGIVAINAARMIREAWRGNDSS